MLKRAACRVGEEIVNVGIGMFPRSSMIDPPAVVLDQGIKLTRIGSGRTNDLSRVSHRPHPRANEGWWGSMVPVIVTPEIERLAP